MRTPEIFGSSIVALGSFNPAIFTSDWLERNELIGRDDADAARQHPSLIVSKQVCQLETDWFALQVLDDRLSLTSKEALTPALKDLAVGIFTLLAHSPVTAVGLNFFGHYKLSGEEEYHKIGDVLAPKDIWEQLYPGENRSCGMADLTILIQPFPRGDIQEFGDEKRITVQPSGRVRGHGVYFALNDHHPIDLKDQDPTNAAELAAQLIDTDWQSVWEESLRVFDGIITNALER